MIRIQSTPRMQMDYLHNLVKRYRSETFLFSCPPHRLQPGTVVLPFCDPFVYSGNHDQCSGHGAIALLYQRVPESHQR